MHPRDSFWQSVAVFVVAVGNRKKTRGNRYGSHEALFPTLTGGGSSIFHYHGASCLICRGAFLMRKNPWKGCTVAAGAGVVWGFQAGGVVVPSR